MRWGRTKNGADDVLSVRKRENGRDRGNQRTVLRGAELRLQEEGSRAGALGAAAVWEVKGEEKLIDDIDRTITLCYNKHGNLTANISNADFAAINELQNNLKLKGVEL